MPDNLIYLKREKILFDTSVYISHLNHGLHDEAIRDLVRQHTLYLHSVVFEELMAGIRNAKEKRMLLALKKPFMASDRMVTPTDGDWHNTGLIVNQLMGKGILSIRKVVSLTHDILIAISCGRLGIRLVTENKKDFDRISSVKLFPFQVLKQP